jgi:cellulose synthase/poly-beta-1,6-N-acetylglucosamine synthase-like glycosyltransferase
MLVQGAVSLLGGVRFERYVRLSLMEAPGGSTPHVSVIAPVKGIDTGIEDNLKSLFTQDYPDYEIIFVIADDLDPARSVIERAMSANPGRSRLIVAGRQPGRSQKVNNLLQGASNISPQTGALVFVDSDAGVARDWLRGLISGLADPAVGASTGYRWYIPASGSFWATLVSAWNGSILTTLGGHGRNFAWGGSSAIRRETFDRIDVARYWHNALSDDYALTSAVERAGLRIRFVPRCLAATREDFRLRSALEFTRRQVAITRIYKPASWWSGIISHSLFVLGFFGGTIWAIQAAVKSGVLGSVRPDVGLSLSAGPLRAYRLMSVIASLLLIYVLGCLKTWLRLKAVGQVLPEAKSTTARIRLMYYLQWPLVSVLFLYDFISSATMRRIKWRGVLYEMRSPNDTVVLGEGD